MFKSVVPNLFGFMVSLFYFRCSERYNYMVIHQTHFEQFEEIKRNPKKDKHNFMWHKHVFSGSYPFNHLTTPHFYHATLEHLWGS